MSTIPTPTLQELKDRPHTLEELQAALVALIELHNKTMNHIFDELERKQNKPFKTSL